MSQQQDWNDLSQEPDNDLAAMLQPGKVAQLKSTDPLQKIKTSLRFTIMWTVLIAALYLWVLICYPYWQIMLTIGVMLLFTVAGTFSAIHQYKKMPPVINSSLSLLSIMEEQYNGISRWMRLQKKSLVFIYPFASAGGFMTGLMFGSGKDLSVLMSKPSTIAWMIGITIVIVPMGIMLAKRLQYKSYGQYLLQLKQNIDSLKA
ncbi:MAG: hypothetical protein QM726_01485 [Chitinophagaceae bacterium]